MAGWNPSSKSTRAPVGLDLGRATLRLARFAPGPGGPRLDAVLSAPTPSGALTADGAPADALALTAAVGELVARAACAGADAVLTSAAVGLLQQDFSLPERDDTPLVEQARRLLAPRLVAPDSEFVFTCERVPSLDGVIRIAACAAPKSWVVALDEVVSGAGLVPVVTELPAYAAALGLAVAGDRTDGRTVLLDLGDGQTTWAVLDTDEVRAMGVVRGGAAACRPSLDWDGDEGPAEALEEYAEQLARLTLECGDSVRVLLHGGGARLAGLRPRLAERLGVPVEVADPFAALAPEERLLLAPEVLGDAPAWLTAVGLAAWDRVE